MRYRQIILEDESYYDDADYWLKKYTRENLDKWPSDSVIRTLVKRYPVERPTSVYRGMNFRTKEAWDKFCVSIKEGKIRFGSISSWTADVDQSLNFALTQPTYFINSELMQAEDEKEKNKERLSGYRGVILKTVAEPNRAINVSYSKFGYETEIILIPGEYNVQIHKIVKSFSDHLEDGDTTIDSVILNTTTNDLSSDNEQKKFLNYVLHHHSENISDEARSHLFKIFRPPPGKFMGYYEEASNADGERNKIRIYFSGVYFSLAINGLFMPKDTLQAKKDAQKAVHDALLLYKKYGEHEIHAPLIQKLANFSGTNNELRIALAKKIRHEYEKECAKIREINIIRDETQKRNAIKQHTKLIKNILSQIP